MSVPMSVVGFPRESAADERRTLVTPSVTTALREAGFTVLAERGIGEGVFCPDADLDAAGVEFAPTTTVWAAPLVLRYKSPDPADVLRLAPGQSVGALFHAEGDPALLAALTMSGVTAYSYEFVRDDDGFPLAAPGGEIAGVQAVLAGAQALQAQRGGRGVLLARINGAARPRVVVIGCGNVGAAAAHTAAALGARVTVLARSRTSADRYRRHLCGHDAVVAADVTIEVNTPAVLRRELRHADLVIGTILISTHTTAPMITVDDLRLMRPGAVIVDATCGYGPGYLPTAGPVQRPGDPPRRVREILHVKLDAQPALVPVTTTAAYTATIAPYLVRLAGVALRGAADPVIEAGRIARAGALTHEVCREHAEHYGIPA